MRATSSWMWRRRRRAISGSWGRAAAGRGAGAQGPLAFSGLNFLQVILAVIPGAPFEVAAGYLFGVIPGTLLCDSTMTIGSVLVFLMVRRFGVKFV